MQQRDVCAAGIIQAIGNFSLVQMFLQEILETFRNAKWKFSNSSHEVVKFYLFYERMEDVQKLAKNMQTPKFNIFPFGNIWCNPSGVEQSVNHCSRIVMARLHVGQARNQLSHMGRSSCLLQHKLVSDNMACEVLYNGSHLGRNGMAV
ncbi:hypothetical protein NC652_024309 [Populus alba x Populus x berolinensis]|nr:hypothetical protein NC652_024309 [Populus alba x Populus x berolinensis]